MKTLTVTLSNNQQVVLTPEDIKMLKPKIDEAFANLDENLYPLLKVSTPEKIKETLENMTDAELEEFAKINDLHKRGGYKPDAFTQKIFSEIFFRAGLGYKQLGHLSSKQSALLETKGIKSR